MHYSNQFIATYDMTADNWLNHFLGKVRQYHSEIEAQLGEQQLIKDLIRK